MPKTNGNDMAYPLSDGEGNFAGGLTKREYFAALTMQGFCANPEMSGSQAFANARFAVKEADALIAELNKDRSENNA